MTYKGYKESLVRGTFDFPIAYYGVDKRHPRYEMMLHWHTEYEFIHVQQGQLHLELNNAPFLLNAGDYAVVSGGVCHQAHPKDCKYECLVLDLDRFVSQSRIDSHRVTGLLHQQYAIYPQLPRDCKDLMAVMDRLFAAMRHPTDGNKLYVQGCLYQFLGLVLRERLYNDAVVNTRRKYLQHNSLKNAIAYIENHFSGRITLDDLAREAGMNRKYFCSFFHNMTHLTPIEYLNNYRIEQACDILLSTNRTIANIAGDCGFNDVSYFTKTFRRYMGITPMKYRQKPIG